MRAQANDKNQIIMPKSAEIDFRIIEFSNLMFQQVSPFKNTDDGHFAIMLYFDQLKETIYNNANTSIDLGNLVFKAPGQTNSFINQRNIVSGYCVQFTEKFLLDNRSLLSVITGFPFFEISLLKNKPLQISSIESEEVCRIYKKIYEEYNYKNSTSQGIINAYLQALLLIIQRIYLLYSNEIEKSSNTIKRQPGDIVQRFESLVWLDTVIAYGNGYNRKTVKDYASLLYIHPNYLNALIKKETGKTAREYIDGQVFNCAKRLLLNEQLPIKEIAWQLSFKENAHFNNFFKRHAGVSPGVFRKQYVLTRA